MARPLPTVNDHFFKTFAKVLINVTILIPSVKQKYSSMCGSMNMNEWLVCNGLFSRVSNNDDNLDQVWIFLLVNW